MDHRIQNQGSAYTIEYNTQYFYITANTKVFGRTSTLQIERNTAKIKQYKNFDTRILASKKIIKKFSFHFLVGILIVKQQPFLVLVTQCSHNATVSQKFIYSVKNVIFISFQSDFGQSKIQAHLKHYLEVSKILDSIRDDILINNFYFSHHYNLTLSCQKLKQDRKMDNRFFWNEDLLEQLFGLGLENYWLLPMIQGFVSSFRVSQNKSTYQYTMISRRSKMKSGTRFNDRGVDDKGNVANFVQTEQIIESNNYIISYIQLRGSVPIEWTQQGMMTDIKFGDRQSSKKKLLAHYSQLQTLYGKIISVNLLSTKKNQKQLSKQFSQALNELHNQYIHFDFNYEKKKQDIHNSIDNFITENQQYLLDKSSDNIFVYDIYNSKINLLQKFFVRTNCLDCSDRTNVIMYKISQAMMRKIQKFINSKEIIQNYKIHLDGDFKDMHCDIWLQNGDRISLIYMGTKSVTSYITRGETKRDFLGYINHGIKSLQRFYNSNISDVKKQQCIEYFLKKTPDSKTNFFLENIKKKLDENLYMNFEQIGLEIITWNCAQSNPKQVFFDNLLTFNEQEVDILIICLQQAVELNTYNVLVGSNTSISYRWKFQVERYLNLHYKQKYSCIAYHDLVGVMTFLFVKEKLVFHVYNIIWNEVKTGFKNNLGNKGAVTLSFFVYDSVISIINCHLQAGQGKISDRIQSIDHIYNNAFSEWKNQLQFQTSDFMFLIGDLNFRLNMTLQNVKELLSQIEFHYSRHEKKEAHAILKFLLSKDQLNQNKEKSIALSRFSEHDILFMPTYKFIKLQTQYNYKSKRTPSWCDRILVSANPLKICKKEYFSRETLQSDHRAVVGSFDFLVGIQNKGTKQCLIIDYLNEDFDSTDYNNKF